MCGIAGIIALRNNNKIETQINEMVSLIAHRGPDGLGIECFNDQIALGHRRLSILDLSPKGRQPMCYLEKYWITFNGEIYNYIELKNELMKEGYSFYTDTDTEVILAAYDKWGDQCVSFFNGMWAFAIYDTEKGVIFCSRDRFGIKPFYYAEQGGDFYFASEIKQILPMLYNVSANREILEAFLARGILDYTEQTMFKGVFQLLAGCNLCYSLSSKKYVITKWYDLNRVQPSDASFDDNSKNFKEYFIDSVKLRLRSDVPIGSCLSGGLDSSSIVCVMNHILKGQSKPIQQHTVSSCFEDKRYDEQEYIDAVVKHTGVNAHKIFPDMSEVFSELDTIIWHMDEPFGSTSVYAQWNVFCEANKHGLTVMLDGQGADEQLAGYTPFYRVLFMNLLKRGQIRDLWHEIYCYSKLRAKSEGIGTLVHIVNVLFSYIFPEAMFRGIKLSYRNITKRLPFPKEFYQNPVVVQSEHLYNIKDYRAYINAGMHQGMQALLHYEDRDSMAHSIEARIPFLDCNLVEQIFSIPLEQKICDGKTKYVMREALKDFLPSEIYNRYSKLGFVTPEDQWIKENKVFFEEELGRSCDVLAPILDKAKVMNWYKKKVKKMWREDFTVWRIICTAHWVKVFNVTL